MSIRGVATLAHVRNSPGDVKRSEVGKATGSEGAKDATLPDILVTLVPTGLVAPYTLAITAIAGIVDKATRKHPHPNQYVGLRWGIFAALVVLTIGFVLATYYSKHPRPERFPWLELAAVTLAAAAWGLATPESALFVAVTGNLKAVLPVLIGAGGAGILAVLSQVLRKPAGG
jgi:hypothetical protein